VIYDRNGYQLVRNVPVYNVVVTPANLPDSPAEVEAIFQRLSDLTGVPVDREAPAGLPCTTDRGIRQLVEEGDTNRPYAEWPIACDVDERTARVVVQQAVDMPGVGIAAVPARDYRTGALTSAVIGYLGPISEELKAQYEALGFVAGRDKIGYSGIEFQYQAVLAGRNGQKLVEHDVAGKDLRDVGEVIQPVPGNNLRLTLDTRLQAAAVSALRNRMEFINRYAGETRTPLGAVIAINPRTGEILAMATLSCRPDNGTCYSYENNRMARFIPLDYYQQLVGDERGKPLINHAIQSPFPPGSTFKLVTAIGATQERVITPDQRIFDPGKIQITNQYFPTIRLRSFVAGSRRARPARPEVRIAQSQHLPCKVAEFLAKSKAEAGGGGQQIRPALGCAPQDRPPPEQAGLIPARTGNGSAGESWSTGDTYSMVTGRVSF
jgi:penicillin-binding protein 2